MEAGRAELVRAKGLEPPHLSIPGPKPGASTSSATPAGPPVGGSYNSAADEGKAKRPGGSALRLGRDRFPGSSRPRKNFSMLSFVIFLAPAKNFPISTILNRLALANDPTLALDRGIGSSRPPDRGGQACARRRPDRSRFIGNRIGASISGSNAPEFMDGSAGPAQLDQARRR